MNLLVRSTDILHNGSRAMYAVSAASFLDWSGQGGVFPPIKNNVFVINASLWFEGQYLWFDLEMDGLRQVYLPKVRYRCRNTVWFTTQIYGGTWSGVQVSDNPMLTSTHGTGDVDIDLASIFIDSYLTIFWFKIRESRRVVF